MDRLLSQVPATHCALTSERTYRPWFTELRGEPGPTLGLDLTAVGGRWYAANLLEGGPARAAGIEAWSELTAIDGEPVASNRRLVWRSGDA